MDAPVANKACMCQRCGYRIDKGEPIRFESCERMARPKWGSGRHSGGVTKAWRPIHAHDCSGWDAAQARAKAAAFSTLYPETANEQPNTL